MFNAVKMEFFKVKKMKSSWILLLVLIAVMAFMVLATQLTLKGWKNNPESYQKYQEAMEETDSSGSVGIQVGTGDVDNEFSIIDDYIAGEDIPFSYLVDNAFTGNFIAFIMAMFCLFFFNSEIKNGYIKNVASQFKSRSVLVFSKLVIGALYSLALMVFSFATVLVSSKLMYSNVTYDAWGSIIKMLLIKWLILFAIGSLILLIIDFIRNTAGSVVLTMAIVLGIVGIIFMLVDVLLKYLDIVGEKFTLSNYTLTGNYTSICTSSSNGSMIRACIVGAAFIVVTVVGTVFTMNKKDIK